MEKARQLGKYRLQEQLGKGGFSTVYRAENMSLGNEVALKILDPALAEDESFVRRFRREARRTALLDHRNIVRVLDLDEADGQFFIAMEYIPSKDLRELFSSEELLPLDRVVSIIRQLGSALDYAHSQSLVHRDVKPGNVLVREDGTVKLTDFGLVKAAEGSKITRTGTTMGTPAYMSPEQTKGTLVDGRADLYALGVMAYEFVTGRVPFQGDTPVSTAYMHVHEKPPMPSTIAYRAEGPIETVLLKALAKEPDDRYQSGAALANALAAAVYDMAEESLVLAYDQAVRLLENRQFGDALKQLDKLESAQPGYRDVAVLIVKAREGEKLAKLYDEANQHLKTARNLASQIASVDPDFPDTQKVFKVVQDKASESVSEDHLAVLFDEALSAFINKRWLRARNLLNELEQQSPGYTRSGQRVSELLAEAQKQLSGSRKRTSITVLQIIGRAFAVFMVVILLLIGLHLLLVRPLIEDSVFTMLETNLDDAVEPEVFKGKGLDCEVLTRKEILDDLAKSLPSNTLAEQVDIQLEDDTIQISAGFGRLSAFIAASPVVNAEDGILDLNEFKTNWLIRVFFSQNGLRDFAEGYINNTILRDGRMWLDEVAIKNGSITVCVTPRSN